MSLVWSVGGQTMVPAYVCWVVCRGTDHGSRGQSVVPWDRPETTMVQSVGGQTRAPGDRPWFQSVSGDRQSLSGDRPRLQGTDHDSRAQTTVPGGRPRFQGTERGSMVQRFPPACPQTGHFKLDMPRRPWLPLHRLVRPAGFMVGIATNLCAVNHHAFTAKCNALHVWLICHEFGIAQVSRETPEYRKVK
jgi:hypothetical protein